ncbi:MAG: copper transporter [Bacillota bacterium]
MFLNLKYHIVSLVAVFLALGLGILIGSAFPGDTTMISQQQLMMGMLESRMESIRQKNESLRARINQLEMNGNIRGQFEKQVLPALVEGRLRGRCVAIISTGERSVTEELASTLQLAGASVQSITSLGGEMKSMEKVADRLQWQNIDQKSFLLKIAVEISSAVMSGDTPAIKTLAGEGILKISGRYGQPVSDVVMVGGAGTENGIDSHIIDYFKSNGVGVYGAEESFASHSCMKEYQKKGLPTVDNIDTAPGQVSLVYAMSGRPGHYGIKSTARSLLPDLDGGVEVYAR